MPDESKKNRHPLAGHQWVVFGPDWDRHPLVSQHLFREFLGFSPVLWVETMGLRVPQWNKRDLRRSVKKSSILSLEGVGVLPQFHMA